MRNTIRETQSEKPSHPGLVRVEGGEAAVRPWVQVRLKGQARPKCLGSSPKSGA